MRLKSELDFDLQFADQQSILLVCFRMLHSRSLSCWPLKLILRSLALQWWPLVFSLLRLIVVQSYSVQLLVSTGLSVNSRGHPSTSRFLHTILSSDLRLLKSYLARRLHIHSFETVNRSQLWHHNLPSYPFTLPLWVAQALTSDWGKVRQAARWPNWNYDHHLYLALVPLYESFDWDYLEVLLAHFYLKILEVLQVFWFYLAIQPVFQSWLEPISSSTVTAGFSAQQLQS